MKKENLKQQIINANKVYREGRPIISDEAFDNLLERYEMLCDKDEYDIFRSSLHESSGKVKHPYILGSLDKLKIEEHTNIKKFINSYVKNSLNVTAKIDGISCRIRYENGKLVSASTRGSGEEGEDLTDKIKYVKCIPHTIKFKETIDIRGELVILKDDFSKLSGFANARNACAGIMNKKYWEIKEVSNVSFIAYTILGPDFNKEQQLKFLENNNFNVAYYNNYNITIPFDELMENLIVDATRNYPYETDGLVVCDINYYNEEKYRPNACRAIKINQLMAVTRIINIDWDGPSKDGSFIPCAVFEPIELGGAIINRASCHNIDYLTEKDIDIGDTVELVKAGDIIPQIVKVTKKHNYIAHTKLIQNSSNIIEDILSDKTEDIQVEYCQRRWKAPTECHSCGTKLIRDNINLRCVNDKCPAQVLHQITAFIKKLGVKHTSYATLDNFGIYSFEDLINFKPDKKYKSQVKLYDELNSKVFTRSKQDLLAAMNFNGVGETLINKIVDFYEFDNIIKSNYSDKYPDGVGELILNRFKVSVLDNLKVVDMFLSDARYNYLEVNQDESRSKSNCQSVCFTGKLFTMGRTEASKLAIEAGYEVKNSVIKGLTYLITNDSESGSSKNKKAKELGTKIINEQEFLKMINNSTIENDVLDLN